MLNEVALIAADLAHFYGFGLDDCPHCSITVGCARVPGCGSSIDHNGCFV